MLDLVEIKRIVSQYKEQIVTFHTDGLNKGSIPNYMKSGIRSCEAATLYSLIRHYNAKNILDIGTGKGFSALYFTKALKDSCLIDGFVDSIDINKNHYDEVFQRFELDKLLNFYLGSSSDVIPKLNKTYDFVLIDGLHTYRQSKEDFINIYPKIKTGGIVAFHDVYDRPLKNSGPCDILTEIKEQDLGEVIFFDDDIFDMFNFQEDINDALRIQKKWEEHNYSYVKPGWNPKCLMAIFVKRKEGENLIFNKEDFVEPTIIKQDDPDVSDWLNS